MKHLMIGAATLALLAGCNASEPATEAADVTLAEIIIGEGDPAEAADALAAMSLVDSGSGVLTFGDSSVDGAKATFSDLTIAGEEAMKAGSLVFEGLDMVDGQASFSKMSLNDISFTAPEGENAEVKLGNIELINPSPELAAWMAASLQGGEVPFPTADKVVFDSWSMTGLTGNFAEDEAEGTFGIDSIEIRDMGDLSAKKATLSGLTVDVFDSSDDIDVDVSLGSVTATNIDARFIEAIQQNSDDPETMIGALMNLASENPMDPGYDSFAMSDLSIAAAGASFAMPSLEGYVTRNDAGQPVKYVTKPYTMTLDADADGGEAGAALLQGLSMVGYESLTLKGESIGEYDPDRDIVDFDAGSNYLELVDGAKISFGGKIEGYSAYSKEAMASFNMADLAAGAEPDPAAMTEAMGKLTVHGFELSIDDDSLVNRILNAVATQSGQDPAELRSQASMGLAMAPMMAQGTGIDMGLVTELTTALSSFITEPGTLTVKLDPAEPLSFASIMENPDPAAYTKDTLGFTATHK
ncbi:MAG: hypothetical protein QNI84_00745 [Henriciella sp.]|nr:hypothetical protein [Henriciella sp.]